MVRKMTEDLRLGLEDTVDLAGLLSFPASDPPGWTPTHVGAPAPSRPWAPQGPELLHDVVQRVVDDIHFLSHSTFEREGTAASLDAAIAMTHRFRDAGLPAKQRPAIDAIPSNVEAVLEGTRHPSENVVVGARYDTEHGGVATDADATSLAVLLTLAHSLAQAPLARSVRLVAFADRGPGRAEGSERGSMRYIDSLLREGPQVSAMVSLDMLAVPAGKLPWSLRRMHSRTKDAVVFSGGFRDRNVIARAKSAFDSAGCGIASAALTLPPFLPALGRSDYRSFARRRIPSLVVTGVTPLRRTRGRRSAAEQSQIDLDRIGRICIALTTLVRELAS